MQDKYQPLRDRGGLVVAGCGYQGRQTHARLLSQWGLLAGVADVNQEAAERCGLQFGVPAFGGPDAIARLLDAQTYAAAVVAVATEHHAAVAKAVLAATDCLVEKPFAVSAVEAAEMFDAAAAFGRVLDVHHPLLEIFPEAALIGRTEIGAARIEATWRRREGVPQTIAPSNPLMDLGAHLLYVQRAWVPTERVPSELRAHYGYYADPRIADRVRCDIHYEAVQLAGVWHPALDVTLLAVYISPAMRAAGLHEEFKLLVDSPRAGAFIQFATAKGASRGGLSLPGRPRTVLKHGLSVVEAQAPALEHFLGTLLGEAEPNVTRSEAILQAHVLEAAAESASQHGELIRL